MKLFIQQRGHGQPLILLHGWGFNGRIWESIAAPLAAQWQVYQVDLPGHGQSVFSNYQLSALTTQLATQLPPQALWLGWSLGGLLAMAMAHDFPAWVRGLMLITTSPRFVTAPDWPYALTPKILTDFRQQLQADADKTWRSFLALQLRDLSVGQRQYVYTQLKLGGYPQLQALQAGLTCLLETDLRFQLKAVTCPSMFCLGERDPLIPVQMGTRCHAWWPEVDLVTIQTAAHIPFLSHSEAFMNAFNRFLALQEDDHRR